MLIQSKRCVLFSTKLLELLVAVQSLYRDVLFLFELCRHGLISLKDKMIYTRPEPLAVASGNGEVWPFTLYWEGLPPSLLGGGSSSGRQPDTWPVSLHNGLVYKGFPQAGKSRLVAVGIAL